MSLRDFIPKKVNNRVVLDVYDGLRHIDKVHHSKLISERNYNHNLGEITAHSINRNKSEYIENQHEFDDLKYGCVTASYSSCEIISIYNVYVYYFGEAKVSFPELIKDFESDGMALNGFFGTSPRVLARYLNSHGFKAVIHNGKDMIKFCEGEKCLVLTFYNNEDNIMDMVHTICLTKEQDGYYGHNVNCNGKVLGPYQSVENFMKSINKGKSKLISSINVK